MSPPAAATAPAPPPTPADPYPPKLIVPKVAAPRLPLLVSPGTNGQD